MSSNNRGFTLVEVLASILILSIIITGFFQFFIFSQNTTSRSQDKLVAINIAQTVLEQIKQDANTGENLDSSSYWDITHPSPAVTYPKIYEPRPYTKNVDGKKYTIEVNVGVKLVNDLQMVTVTVEGVNSKIKSSVKGLVKLWT